MGDIEYTLILYWHILAMYPKFRMVQNHVEICWSSILGERPERGMGWFCPPHSTCKTPWRRWIFLRQTHWTKFFSMSQAPWRVQCWGRRSSYAGPVKKTYAEPEKTWSWNLLLQLETCPFLEKTVPPNIADFRMFTDYSHKHDTPMGVIHRYTRLVYHSQATAIL